MSTIKVNNLESSTGGGVVAKLASVNGGGIGTKNLVINGAMIIQQKMNAYTSGGQNLTGIKTTDRFRGDWSGTCLLYTSPSPRDGLLSRMPSSA